MRDYVVRCFWQPIGDYAAGHNAPREENTIVWVGGEQDDCDYMRQLLAEDYAARNALRAPRHYKNGKSVIHESNEVHVEFYVSEVVS